MGRHITTVSSATLQKAPGLGNRSAIRIVAGCGQSIPGRRGIGTVELKLERSRGDRLEIDEWHASGAGLAPTLYTSCASAGKGVGPAASYYQACEARPGDGDMKKGAKRTR